MSDLRPPQQRGAVGSDAAGREVGATREHASRPDRGSGGSELDGPPVGAISGRVFVAWFGTIFVLLCIGVLVGGFMVTGGVRRTASETDNAMRTLAWELLRWSTAHNGTFPTSETEFIDGLRLAVDPPAPPARDTPSDPELWPSDARTALQGRKLANIPEALERITVLWPQKPTLAPELSPGNKPMLPGTANAVRGWLTAWVDHHRTP